MNAVGRHFAGVDRGFDLSQGSQGGGTFDSLATPTVLFASAEVFPFSKVGGLGDVAGSLPRALCDIGCTVAVVSPRYGFIDWDRHLSSEYICTIDVRIGERLAPCEVFRLTHNGVVHYFLGNEEYFGRGKVYGYDDDLERFAFFSKAVCECAMRLGEYVQAFRCDVIHCNDWHTALVPVFLQAYVACEGDRPGIRTVLTVHNALFQGEYPSERFGEACGFAPGSTEARRVQVRAGASSCLAGGLRCADWITTVSPSYAEEVKQHEGSGQLADIFSQRADVVSGILNGIDQDIWNPGTDGAIEHNYHVDDMAGKPCCKCALLNELGLACDEDRPLAVMVSRLTEQKGFDLLCSCLPDILGSGVNVAILGTGEERFARMLAQLMRAYPENARHVDAFDEQMAHRLYAAGDMLLMPSRFEPCGLSQLIALRYGTLPVVRDTGGLHDTVQPYDSHAGVDEGTGTGFVFSDATPAALCDCVLRASAVYRHEPKAWRAMQQRAMCADFSWSQSAVEYCKIYERIVHAQPEERA